jgi:hypothetical protein
MQTLWMADFDVLIWRLIKREDKFMAAPRSRNRRKALARINRMIIRAVETRDSYHALYAASTDAHA